MKLPSVTSLIQKGTSTFRRFPLAIISAVIASVYCILLVHLPYNDYGADHRYWNIISSSYLGMLVFLNITIYTERISLKKLSKVLFQLAGVAVIIGYYFTLPDHFIFIYTIRFILFLIGLHLLIAFAPYINKTELNGFWQYNKVIFLRILTSALYTLVLYAGLAIAILAVDNLFKLHINSRTYNDLWILLAGVFNTWFFLAGFPANYDALELSQEYPKGLKIFTQYVLLPLVTVYLLILYAYMVKIIVEWHLPIGWVSYLVLCFSIAGIFSLLLIYPIRNNEKNKWILNYSRFFYLALVPLIILLFLAIARRVHDYGITEDRYFILVLALWLSLIAVYFILSKTKNIKLIPASLCVVAFLSSFGPWSAFNVSIYSQKKRLNTVFEKTHILQNGKATSIHDTLSFKDRKEISSVVDYLTETHGYKTLQPYFTANLDTLLKKDSEDHSYYSSDRTEKILSLINVSYVASYTTEENIHENYVNYRSNYDDSAIDITGYKYLISEWSYNRYSVDTQKFSIGAENRKVYVHCDSAGKQLSIVFDKTDSLLFDISPLLKSLNQKNPNNDQNQTSEMMLETSNNKSGAKIIFKTISGTLTDKLQFTVMNMNAEILIRFK